MKKKKNKFKQKIEDNDKKIMTCEKLMQKKRNTNKYDSLFEKILVNTNNLWLPNKQNKLNDKILDNEYLSHSWFNITEYVPNLNNDIYNAKIEHPIVNEIIKCKKIKMHPNKLQKQLLLNWMKSYIIMYNETIKIFKKYRFGREKITLNWKKLRTYYLKNIKNDILNKSQLINDIPIINNKPINTKINSHVLDFAIQDACCKMQGCISNLKNRNIKYFRLRYLKQTKSTMILKIEKAFIHSTKNTFCSTIFKDNFILENNFQLNNIKSDFTIHYDRKKDEFQLLIPIKLQQLINNTKKDSCSLDPGIKTFMTVFSNNKCAEIGNNLRETVIKYHRHIDRANNSDTKKDHIKEKIKRTYYKKISNTIDDLHWKTINYLTKNFNDVLIGNLSTKDIIKNKSNNWLQANDKITAQYMGLFKFKQRLQYKCLLKSVGYKEVDEAYTTMACSRCTYQNNVGNKRHIKCSFCKLSIDRDFNGARNILLKGTN